MLATLARHVPDGPQWAHEVKHDGFRMLCRREGKRARVFSRTALDWTDKVPAIVAALAALPVTSATIDGEAVVCDPQGVSDFEVLRTALARRQGSPEAFLYAFDLMTVRDGRRIGSRSRTRRARPRSGSRESSGDVSPRKMRK
jgi:bifunctional non-homologous end joining protein LigD